MTLTASLLNAPHVGVRDLRTHLSRMLHSSKTLIVTERGRPKRVILPYAVIVGIAETLGELDDRELAQAVTFSRKARNKGVAPISVAESFKKFKSRPRAR